jgi:hypothetical protein
MEVHQTKIPCRKKPNNLQRQIRCAGSKHTLTHPLLLSFSSYTSCGCEDNDESLEKTLQFSNIPLEND